MESTTTKVLLEVKPGRLFRLGKNLYLRAFDMPLATNGDYPCHLVGETTGENVIWYSFITHPHHLHYIAPRVEVELGEIVAKWEERLD